jgi:hypothetical protein
VLVRSVDKPNRRRFEAAACPDASVDLALPRFGGCDGCQRRR